MANMQFGAYSFEVSEPDKILFPDIELSKAGLIDYYVKVADVMLPHCRQRPLTLQRFPDGIEADGFYQQQRSDYFPDWLHSVSTPRASDKRKHVEHVLADDQASLAYLANQAVISFHGWLSRQNNLQQPDRLVFDLDPPDDDFTSARQAALQLRELMMKLGMTPFVMTTGSRGLHVVAPLRPQHTFDAVREYARAMAQQLAESCPDKLTTEQRKNKRRGRLYLDVMRNAYGQTSVLPYSLRAIAGAPVATPLDWDELDNHELHAQSYTVKNIFHRLGQREDPWLHMDRHGVDLDTLPDPS